MRLHAFFLCFVSLLLSCKTTRENHRTSEPNSNTEGSPGTIETEDNLPACDDLTLGRVYWVRSLNAQMSCEEGGTWLPRQVDPDGKKDPAFSPRGIQ